MDGGWDVQGMVCRNREVHSECVFVTESPSLMQDNEESKGNISSLRPL